MKKIGGILALVVVLSCTKDMPNDGIPAYLNVNSSKLVSNIFGEPNSDIYGLSVSVENDNRGILQMPFKVPVLNSGIKSTIFIPYVKKNNLSNNIVKYSMYKPISLDLNYVPKEITDTTLIFQYEDNVKALLVENFEIALNFSSATSSTFAKNGNGSMKIEAITNTKDSILGAYYYKKITFDPYKETYLEFDYFMSSGAFTPSLSYEDANLKPIKLFGGNRLTPNNKWTHVYWHLSPLVGLAEVNELTLVFFLTPEIDKEKAEVFIDNIRILEK